MIRLIFYTVLHLVGNLCLGQTTFPTYDSVHIFWQPDVKLTSKDYQGLPTQNEIQLMRKYGFSASASVGIWSILDIPERKKDRNKKFEKVYFAPAFEKTTSSAKSDDTLQVQMQNVYFDICEIWARWARKTLKKAQDSINATGTVTMLYMTVKRDMNNRRIAMYSSYFKDVFVDKKEGSFVKWRQEIDNLLVSSKAWATNPEDCYRLMSKKPIEPGYIQAPKVVGALEKYEPDIYRKG